MDCQNCTLRGNKIVPWQNPAAKQYPVLLVGQAPGQIESVTGVPFTGPAGKVLWRLLKEAGLNKQHLAITNMVQCYPPGDRPPTDQEVACCASHLEHELQTLKPELVVALGDVAVRHLTGLQGARRVAGQFYPLLNKWGWKCQVLCCLHPSFVMRQRQWILPAIKHFEQIPKFFTSSLSTEEEPTFVYDPSPSQLAEQLQAWSKGLTAFDIETPGELNPRKAEVIGISFCGEPGKAVALDLHPGHPCWTVIKSFLEDQSAKKCAQNANFDIACLETAGVTVRGLSFDTRLAEHILASGTPAGLDFLRSKYTNIPPYKPTKASVRERIAEWDKKDRLRYSALDALVTYRVALAQQELFTAREWTVHNDILLPLVFVILRMERKGVLVDTKKLAHLYAKIAPQMDNMLKHTFGPLGLNPASPKQLKAYLGVSSTSEKELVDCLKRGHPKSELIRQVLAYRKLAKIQSVYLLGVYERLEHGRIHTTFKIEGTETGRLSSQNPNLQNVPPPVRVIYCADPGKVMVEADYSQLELRVLAVVSQEQTAIRELFFEGKNTHHLMGQTIYGRTWDQLTPEERNRAKAVVFGTAYGRSARSIAMEFGISTMEAERWQALCITRYPGFLTYRERQAQALRSGVVYTLFGRKRLVQTLTQALNTPIQSAASDITLTSLIELDKAGVDLRITVHDSIVAEFDEKDWQEGAREMKRIMERPIPQLGSYSFPTKMGVGYNWYQLEEVKL